MKPCIALDIETTGFDAIKDQVIEIAAVKFQDDQIVESFQTLINPQVPIPSMVSHITGIKEDDLKEAPLFPQIQDKLMQFLGNDPIIGHNIDFDINFLRAKGLNIQNPLYDTLALSGILLPGLPSYSLDTLGRLLKITHEQKHRAMSDTKACYQLFLHLMQKISEISPDVRHVINTLLLKTDWQLKELFHFKKDSNQPLESLENILQNLLAKRDQPSREILKSDADQKLKQAIEESLAHGKKMLIEASVGLDIKNSALLAGSDWSNRSNQKGIIATHQHFFENSIIPDGVALFNAPDTFLSLQRLQQFMEKKSLADYEISFLIKIILWLKNTKNGSLHELSFQGKELTLLDEICCNYYLCAHDEQKCFFQKALNAIKNAGVIMVSQNFFFKDRFSEEPLLPQSNYLILDQVEELEKNFTEALAIQISFQSLNRPFEKIKNLLEEANLHQKLYKSVQSLGSRIEILFGLLGIFIEKNSQPFQFCIYLQEGPGLSGNIDWQKVEESGKRILESGHEIIAELEKNNNENPLQQALDEAKKKLQILNDILFQKNPESSLRWIAKGQDESIYLKKIPTNIGLMLQNKILNKQKSCVLISESLTVEHFFDFVRKTLQLDKNFEEMSISPNHDLKKIKVFIVEDIPPPAADGSFIACSEIIRKIILTNKGRTVVLFTSKKAIAATYHAIAPGLKDEGITVLAQYVTGGKGKILEYYKDEADTSALFVTDHFWEKSGLDNGEVDCLVIQKLPFAPPDDPILVSKRPHYQDLFNDFQVPHAILTFKHQISRLAEAAKTKGHIVILDSRIKQKSYGGKFLASLPKNIAQEYIKKENLLEVW